MTQTSLRTFPEALLIDPLQEKSISIVGMTHALPRRDVDLYDAVADHVAGRLALPNSEVHYEGYIRSAESEVSVALPAVRQKHTLLTKYILAQHEIFDLMGLVDQGQYLIHPYKNAQWTNHDMSTLDIARNLRYTDIAREAAEWEAELAETRAMSNVEKVQFIDNFYSEVADASLAPDPTWTKIDERRENIAIDAAQTALQSGTDHITLLWGQDHMLSLQLSFARMGFQSV